MGKRIFETAQFYRDVLSDFPNLNQVVRIYHPDLQGPFDTAHLIWGQDILVALFDCPDIVHALLSLITETYRSWMKAWKDFIGEDSCLTAHWSFYMKGAIMLRDDSPIMLSPDHYEEFVKPYDRILLDEFTGGIHFCGKGDNFIESMCNSDNLFGLHCSQPELNDMELLIESARANAVILLEIPEKYCSGRLKTGAFVVR